MKSRLVNLLEEAQFAEIVEIAAGNKRVLSLLSAQTYHADNLIGWRAVQVFGMAAQRIAEGGAKAMSNMCAITCGGSSGWSMMNRVASAGALRN